MIADFMQWYIDRRTKLLRQRDADYAEWRYMLRTQGYHPSPENDARLASAESDYNRSHRELATFMAECKRYFWWGLTYKQKCEQFHRLQHGASYGYPSAYDNYIDAEETEAARYRR